MDGPFSSSNFNATRPNRLSTINARLDPKLRPLKRIDLLRNIRITVVIAPRGPLQARLAPLQLDRLVVRILGPGPAGAQPAVLQRHLELARDEDLAELQIAEHGPEDGQRRGDGGDVDLEGGVHDGRGSVPGRVEGGRGGGGGVDEGA